MPQDLPLDALARRTVALIDDPATSPPALYKAAGVTQLAGQAAWSVPYPWLSQQEMVGPWAAPTAGAWERVGGGVLAGHAGG